MSESPHPPDEDWPPNPIAGPLAQQGGLDGIGCLALAGALLCGTIFLAPLGVLLVTIAAILFGVSLVRRKFLTRTEAPCPYCRVRVTFRGEGLKPCPDCCHPVVVVQGQLGRPEGIT